MARGPVKHGLHSRARQLGLPQGACGRRTWRMRCRCAGWKARPTSAPSSSSPGTYTATVPPGCRPCSPCATSCSTSRRTPPGVTWRATTTSPGAARSRWAPSPPSSITATTSFTMSASAGSAPSTCSMTRRPRPPCWIPPPGRCGAWATRPCAARRPSPRTRSAAC